MGIFQEKVDVGNAKLPRRLHPFMKRALPLLLVIPWLTVGYVAYGQKVVAPSPVIARGFTDVPAATIVLAGNPLGGPVISDLLVAEGQSIKGGDVVAVLSNFATASSILQIKEAELKKQGLRREALTTGYRITQLAMQEIVLKTSADELQHKIKESAQSSKPSDIKEVEINISRSHLEREQIRMTAMKQMLQNELQQLDAVITMSKAEVENAKDDLNQAQVRSPIDGVVTQVFSRRGERISPFGIVKIIDMGQLRVLTDVDDIQVVKLSVGGKVDVVFQGSTTRHGGKIARIASGLKRTQRADADNCASADGRLVQLEIELDDLASVPKMIGREARVTFH